MSAETRDNPVLLVVDDEPEIREIIAFCAQDLGFQVLEAGDGAQALEVVRNEKVDIICSDLMMPRVTGITFLSHLRDEGRFQPFILLTAYPSQDSTIQALRLGAFDYIEKPFDTDELKSLLQEALRVSMEYQKIDSNEPVQPLAEKTSSLPVNLRDAVQVINRLKALRYSTNEDIAKEDELPRIRELFVSEASPQLIFCEAAIKSLSSPEHRTFELGYLFRVMQTIAQAAAAIHEPSIESFAKTSEYFFTMLRVQPRMVNERLIALAALANEKLRLAISYLGTDSLPEEFKEVEKQLYHEAQKLSGQAAA
jgi:CheY-like chemotaxis protein